MSRLLAEGFTRLRKNKGFWLCMGIMGACGACFAIFGMYNQKKTGYIIGLEDIFFDYTVIISILSAAFISMFLGTEYSDGTIRNKLIVGHTRCNLYLSNLIVNSVAVFLLNFSYTVACSMVGGLMIGFPIRQKLSLFGMLFALGLLTDLAFTAIFTLLGMLRQNKASASVICILGVLVLFFSSAYIRSRLWEPEIHEAYMFITDKGDIITQEEEKNPNYVEGPKRKVYEFLHDFLPTGQSLQIYDMEVEHPWNLAIYSIVIVLASTGAGVWAFGRIDIK